MRKSKILTKLAVGAMLLSTTIFGTGEKAKAAGEVVLTSGKTVTAALDSRDDQDVYKFVVPDTGEFTIDFEKANPVEKEANWKLTVFAGNDEIKSEDGTNDVHFGTYGFKKGTVIYVTVNDWVDATRKSYNITVNFKKTDDREQEYNDSKSSAQPIQMNKQYYGSAEDGDKDWYSVTTDTGYLDLDFWVLNSTGSDRKWAIDIYDSKGTKIDYYDFINADVKTDHLAYRKGTKLYICVSPYTGSGFYEYSFRVNSHKTNSWEKESNNSIATATELKYIGSVYGNLNMTSGDKDYYKVYIPKSGSLRYSLQKLNTDKDIEFGWDVALFDSNLRQVGTTIDGIKDYANKTVTVKKGTYYIRITKNWSMDDKIDYRLSTYFVSAPSQVSSVKVSVSHRKAILSWKKIAGVKGYQIRYSTKSNMKGARTIGATSSAKYITKTLSKRMYYFQVRAYKMSGKTKVYGSWSGVKAVRVR